MAKYKDLADAYDFAATELSKRRGGRTNLPDPQAVHGGGGPKDYAWLDAITIWARAEATDPGSGDRPYWFMLYFIPDPNQPRPVWTDEEMKILKEAVRDFGCLLCEIDFVPPCACPRRGCLRRRKKRFDKAS